MSVVLPIEPDTRFRRYTASAGQTQFSIPFPFQQTADITIMRLLDVDWQILDPSTYEITGVDDPAGGTVTFSSGRAAGDIIGVIGKAILDRLSSVVRDGRFKSALTDDEFDRNRIIQQEQQRDIDRSLKVDFNQQSLLPIPLPDPGKPIVWRDDGRGWKNGAETYDGLRGRVDQEVLDRIAGDLAIASLISQGGPIEVAVFDTRLAVSFATIKGTTNVIRTGGYVLPGDGGEGIYKRVNAEPAHAGKVQSADGAWWELCADIVDIRMFGANKDNLDNTDPINNALVYATGKKLFIPPYRFVTTGLLNGVAGVGLYGVRGKSEIYSPTLPSGGSLLGVRQLQFSGVSGFSVKDILFNASALTPVAGMRCIWVMDCDHYTIEDNDFETPGAAVASIRSSSYRIRGNHVDLISPTGLPYHDGIIDQWDGCHDFRVVDNDIDGHNIGKYGVLVTGQATDGTANACHDFDIDDNRVQRVSQLGIWVNGRNGVNYTLKIAGNQVKNVTAFHGVAVSDSHDGRVYGNMIDGVAGNGVRLFSETGAGGSFGTSNISLIGNVIKNTNQAGSASSQDGAAIAIVNTGTNGTVSGNIVDGTQHTYALSLGATTSNINVEPNALVAGTLGTILDSGASNYVIEKQKAAFYIPTLTGITNVSAATTAQARYERKNSIVRMGGSVTVTPTAGSSGSPVRTQVNISLPIASNLTSTANDLSGTAASTFGHVGGLSADTTNKVATLSFMASSTSAVTLYYEFEYTVK